MVERESAWLSPDETSTYLEVGSDPMFCWIDRFGMRAYRMGRLWEFKKDRIEAGGGSTESSREDAGKDSTK